MYFCCFFFLAADLRTLSAFVVISAWVVKRSCETLNIYLLFCAHVCVCHPDMLWHAWRWLSMVGFALSAEAITQMRLSPFGFAKQLPQHKDVLRCKHIIKLQGCVLPFLSSESSCCLVKQRSFDSYISVPRAGLCTLFGFWHEICRRYFLHNKVNFKLPPPDPAELFTLLYIVVSATLMWVWLMPQDTPGMLSA